LLQRPPLSYLLWQNVRLCTNFGSLLLNSWSCWIQTNDNFQYI